MMEDQEKNGPQIVGSFLCIGLQSYFYGESAFVEVKVRISLLWWSVGGSRCFAPVGLALDRLRGLFHRPLDTLTARESTGLSSDVRALSGPIPLLLFRIILKDGMKPSFNIMVERRGIELYQAFSKSENR